MGLQTKIDNLKTEINNHRGFGRRFKLFLEANEVWAAYETYVNHDYRRVEYFMRLCVQMLLQASSVEMSFLTLNNEPPAAVQYEASIWCDRIKSVRDKMSEVEERVKSTWNDLSMQSVRKYLIDNKGKGNKEFAEGLRDELKERFFWRRWLIISFDPVRGIAKHESAGDRNSIIFSNTEGRGLFVGSTDVDTIFDRELALKTINQLEHVPKERDCCNTFRGFFGIPICIR